MFTPFSYKAGAGSVANYISSLAVFNLRSSNMEATWLHKASTTENVPEPAT